MPAKNIYHYLDLTRKYGRGTFVLLLIILLMCSIPFIYPYLKGKEDVPPGIDSSLVLLQAKRAAATKKNNAWNKEENLRQYDQPYYHTASSRTGKKGTLFYFDPNTITETEWKKLGLRDKTIAVIMKYRSKGGRFREPGDIKKIWGLFPDEAERLLPYVRIDNAGEISSAKIYSNTFPERKTGGHKKLIAVDINSSDTAAWVDLPGIGSKLSQRILNFRDKLGGFYSVQQVAETFGLPDSVFQKIKPFLQLSGDVKKININIAAIDDLKMHPYIRYQLGNAIVQYRTQHGGFRNIADIKKIMIVSDELFNKLSPYLVVQ